MFSNFVTQNTTIVSCFNARSCHPKHLAQDSNISFSPDAQELKEFVKVVYFQHNTVMLVCKCVCFLSFAFMPEMFKYTCSHFLVQKERILTVAEVMQLTDKLNTLA